MKPLQPIVEQKGCYDPEGGNPVLKFNIGGGLPRNRALEIINHRSRNSKATFYEF